MTPEMDFFLRFSPIVMTVIVSIPVLYGFVAARKGHLREEYKFAKDFLKDVVEDKTMHPFAREKGMQALANHRNVRPEEVEYVLTLPSPAQALRNYVQGRPYLLFESLDHGPVIRFLPKFANVWSRRWHKIFYGTGYFVCALTAMLPVMLAGVAGLTLTQMVVTWVIALVVFGPAAAMMLVTGIYIDRAEALLKIIADAPPRPPGSVPLELKLVEGQA